MVDICSGNVSNIGDSEMVTVSAEFSKGAMVLYESDGDEREYWLGCSELAKAVP